MSTKQQQHNNNNDDNNNSNYNDSTNNNKNKYNIEQQQPQIQHKNNKTKQPQQPMNSKKIEKRQILENNARKWRLPQNHFFFEMLGRPENPLFVFSLRNKWFRDHFKKPRNGKLSGANMPREKPPFSSTQQTARSAKNAKYTTFSREVWQLCSLRAVQQDIRTPEKDLKATFAALSACRLRTAPNH